jgi:hypothetical protein
MTTITVDADKVIIGSVSLEKLLHMVYQQGKKDAFIDNEKTTFIQLSNELEGRSRKISVQTPTKKAREAKVKILKFEVKRSAIYKMDINNIENEMRCNSCLLSLN